jgi:hypothetical protein
LFFSWFTARRLTVSFWRFTAAVQSRNAAAISSRVIFLQSGFSETTTGSAFRQADEQSETLE